LRHQKQFFYAGIPLILIAVHKKMVCGTIPRDSILFVDENKLLVGMSALFFVIL